MSDETIPRRSGIPPIPEKWPEPVDGDTLLDSLRAVFDRFLFLPQGASTALALWVVHTYAIAAAEHFPIIFARSPEKGCGKTTLLNVLRSLVRQPLMVANLSIAVLFRVVDEARPTLLIDEADMFLRAKEDLIGLLNSGHERAGSAVRMDKVGDRYEWRAYSTWGPKSIAAIGKLPEPLVDRSIVIYLHRKPRGVWLDRFSQAVEKSLEPLRQQTVRWVVDNLDALRDADPAMPGDLSNRPADNWRPLLAIADAVSPRWAADARNAAIALSSEEVPNVSEQRMLLADIKAYFAESQADAVSTGDLQRWLSKLRDRPWASYRGDSAINGHTIARLLEEYGVKPRKYRIDENKTVRGYVLDALLQRILATYVPDVPEQTEQSEREGEFVPDVPHVPDSKPAGSQRSSDERERA